MCGVVGALGDWAAKLPDAVAALQHRGIRSQIKTVSFGGIGHVRLPIVGLGEEYDQPIEVDDRLIGFVGEILDFQETHPHYRCDTPLVVELMSEPRKEGQSSPFADRDGFWGIITLDNDLLYVMTDYLGQKPMYYRTDLPAAASEPDALKVFGPTTLDEVYLSACIKWGYCPDVSRTPYNEIKHVLPGEMVCLCFPDDQEPFGSVLRQSVLDPLTPYPGNHPTSLRDEIELAVKRRVLSSDVQVACLLSGGLDSSIVYTLAKRHGNIQPYYVQDRGDRDGDVDYWKATRLVNDISSWTPSSLKRVYWTGVDETEALRIMQEPIDLGSLLPQVSLSRAVGERVCLTGDGADELFGGYSRSMRYDSQHSDVFQELPAWHLPRLDRVMMKHMIEVRSPFLARRVAQMALALPWEMRQDKRFLRRLFSDILPPSVTEAAKKALRTKVVGDSREERTAWAVARFREQHAQ